MKKILIVEDVEYNRDLLTQLLEEEFEVIAGTDGEAGIAMAERERPDLILMDLSMPVLDGWEATRRLKADKRLKTIPVIALTSRVMPGDEAKARACGCDDFLTKPLDEVLLFKMLHRFLGNDDA
jgi:two-component system, cell cycle response regulator DivK